MTACHPVTITRGRLTSASAGLRSGAHAARLDRGTSYRLFTASPVHALLETRRDQQAPFMRALPWYPQDTVRLVKDDSPVPRLSRGGVLTGGGQRTTPSLVPTRLQCCFAGKRLGAGVSMHASTGHLDYVRCGTYSMRAPL